MKITKQRSRDHLISYPTDEWANRLLPIRIIQSDGNYWSSDAWCFFLCSVIQDGKRACPPAQSYPPKGMVQIEGRATSLDLLSIERTESMPVCMFIV